MPIKKIMIAATVSLTVANILHAQDIESVKKQLLLNRTKDAKTEVDKVAANPKFNTKPDFWILKSTVYGNLATTPGNSKEDSMAYLKESLADLKKYSELDPTDKLTTTPPYSDIARNLYVVHFNSGIAKFNAKDWQSAYDDLSTSAMLSNYLIKNKVLPGPIDTNSVLYSGAAAQNMKNDTEAAKWFTKLAEAKVAGKDNEFLYQFLTNYYLQKKDDANFKKYRQLGIELYPSSKYFTAVEGELARSSGDFNDVVKYYEEKVNANPNDYEQQYDFGAEIYDHLYPRDTSKTPNVDVGAWETKMKAAFEKAAELKPEKGMPYAVIANSYAKKADAINNKITAVSDEVRNFNKGAKPDKLGKFPPVPKDMTARREALYKDYYATLDAAVPYFEKAADRFAKTTTLEPIEKQFYKNAASNLIDIYSMKKTNAKGKPADIAKFTAEQKKWETTYDTIK